MLLVFSGIFLFTFKDMGYLKKLILGLFAYLLKGIWIMEYLLVFFQGYGILGTPYTSLFASSESQLKNL